MVKIMHKFSSSESLTLDYAKAIGIFFVVLGHYDASVMNLFKPYTFHMPLFFFIGGMTLNYRKKTSHYLKTISKSIVLYAALTYLITGLISELISKHYSIPVLGNAFISNPITTITTAFQYNFANNRLFVVAWFLVAYAIASTACFFICKLTYNRGIEGSAAILFCAGILLGVFAIDVISPAKTSQAENLLVQSLVALMFFMIGNSLRQFISVFTSPFIAMMCCVIIYLLRSYGVTSDFIMSISSYPYGSVITIAQAACGIYIVMFMSVAVSGNNCQWLLFIGKRTKSIMSYHILSFILLDIIFYKAGMYSIQKTDAFTHYKSWFSMPLYVSFAIALPAIANHLYFSVKNFLKPQSMLNQKST